MRIHEPAEIVRVDSAVAPHVIREQALVQILIAIAGDHGAFAYAGMLRQRRFDLAQLDAKAAELDLVIATAGKFDPAIGAQSRPITGAIQTRSVDDDEFLCG